ncbi:MAG: hypothetical protein Q4F00_06235 [bacterium]|nr:hypothetical protein [bacterium]
MQHTNFVMLGLTGSGKTCYLLGMYKRMLAGMKGFTLTTDDDTDVDLRQRYARLNDASLGPDRFPRPTDQAEVLNFLLNYAYSSIMSFDWIDYPGGHLENKNYGNAEEYQKLAAYIKKSSCLFICVDGELLKGDDDNEDKIDYIKDNCSSIINPFLEKYINENKYLPPIAIIVTKWDLCKDDVKDDDLIEIMREAFTPLFVEGNNSDRLVAIVPVSLGPNISEEGNRGRLKPKNIQLPIYMGIWFSLYEYQRQIEEEIAINNHKIEYNNFVINKEKEKWFGFLRRDDKLINSRNSYNKQITNETSAKVEQLEKAWRDSQLLLETLKEKLPKTFFNGTPYESFEDAAEKYLLTRYSGDN